MNHAGKIRTGNPTRTPDRYPVFREGDGLPRLKECIRLLISEESRLQLDIGAVVVGKRLPPIKTIRVNSPGPNFLCGCLGLVGKLRGSGVCSGLRAAREVFV